MKLGVSACLLGENCRYNGEHARDKFITNTLADYFTYVPFCPEDIAFGSPRDAIRLVDDGEKISVLTSNESKDLTLPLLEASDYDAKRAGKLALCGFILKSRSPTCGLERVKLYSKSAPYGEKKAVGLFAQKLLEYYPYLPIEEEGRLQDPWLRENFLLQVFAYDDVQQFVKSSPTIRDLVQFHTNYKYLIYAKSHDAYKTLGNIVANHAKQPFDTVLKNYHDTFLASIALKSKRSNHYNALIHMYGYFKNMVSAEEKEEILEALEEFKSGILPLIAVIKMLRLYIHKFDVTYLKSQKFLEPYPKALGLRSEIGAFK